MFSNWITEHILATARPSTRLMQQFDILNKFKTENIKAIINLQEPGEHKDCGGNYKPFLDLGKGRFRESINHGRAFIVWKKICLESHKPFTVWIFFFFTESLQSYSSGFHSKIEKNCTYSQKFLQRKTILVVFENLLIFRFFSKCFAFCVN